jgi:glutathione S-transferase
MDGFSLYTSVGPNPRIVRMFATEKGLSLSEVDVDIGSGENRRAAYLALNPAGETPALKCADGLVLGEATVICEYLEEVANLGPSLLGESAAERAVNRMWVRRIDLKVVQPFTGGFRYGPALSFFKSRVRCIPQASEDLFEVTRDGLAWIEDQMDGSPFLTGENLRLSDIVLYCFLDFNAAQVGRPLLAGFRRLPIWFEEIQARPSAFDTRC